MLRFAWPPKPRLKSGVYTDKEFDTVWRGLTDLPEFIAAEARLVELGKQITAAAPEHRAATVARRRPSLTAPPSRAHGGCSRE